MGFRLYATVIYIIFAGVKTAVLGTELVKIKNKLSGEWKLREERERNVGQAFPFWAALCRRASAFLIELSHADINDH